jgi:hypothetical protein
VLEHLHGAGARSVALAVAANNHRAVAVYRAKFGFAAVDTLPNEFGNGQEYHLMRLDLDAWWRANGENGNGENGNGEMGNGEMGNGAQSNGAHAARDEVQ